MRFITLMALAFGLMTAAATAATVNITSINGVWANVTGAVAAGTGTNQITWGTPATGAGPSGYTFDATATPFQPLSSPFDVGTFTHDNFPIFAPSITGADLVMNVMGDVDGNAFSMSGVYSFSHIETPNDGPCPVGGTPCADLVTFTGTSGLFGDEVTVDGVDYIFELTGFADGLTFVTEENQSNSAELFGAFTVVPEVPLPAAGWMLLAGIGGLFAMKRRKS